ncbi:ribonuclease H [Paenibacillus thermoaerophilus]|uniref:Ribonuclease H n=1 Tax=Paenibacillus thermoaerophilus TaxID=1215385 RepID=A0ABW2V1T2_9BACL|nr:ribonuclease H family protein [Paenibacillus thermoaerophilus]TMV13896.1 ribonuclease H [Paenibacillus thermoaerophilus]
MAKTKYYVVWVGRKPGIYTTWAECQEQVHRFEGARFKSYESKAEAEAAFQSGWSGEGGQEAPARPDARSRPASPEQSASYAEQDEIDYDSISVDVGTRGNPGPTEYKGVDTRTGEVLFSYGPVWGTNNLGEFLAIVHALAYLKKLGSSKTVYSDSANAIKWVKQKAVFSTLPRDESTREIWSLVDRAIAWLKTNDYDNKVLKWQTDKWGEIKADYGRK